MENGGSVVEFFYNIVPGTIFLFLLKGYGIFDLQWLIGKSDTLVLFAYVIVGLFLGFVFQGCSMILRQELGWNNKKFRTVKENNTSFEDAYKTLGLGEIKDITDKKLKEAFYRMDSSLRKETPSFLPTHFSSLFAFWANIACGMSFLLVCILAKYGFYIMQHPSKLLSLIIFIVYLIFFWILADKHLKSFYDVILNSYYMEKVKKSTSQQIVELIRNIV
jgi:hypothetical protein